MFHKTTIFLLWNINRVVHGVCENVPTKLQYILAVEQTPCSLKQIVTSLSKAMGSGRTKEIPAEEFFLYKDATVKIYCLGEFF